MCDERTVFNRIRLLFLFFRDNLSGCEDTSCELQPHAAMADDVCPWDMADGSDKKRSLPTSIAEERERRLSTSSSSRKNSSGAAAYDSAASADETSQSDSVAGRLRRSCGLGGGDRRRGSSATCTPQQTVDRPSVSSAEDFDLGPSPESKSPEKQQAGCSSSTSPMHEQPAGLYAAADASKPCNRKKLLKTLSLARKQSVTPVINVSSVDRDGGEPSAKAAAGGDERADAVIAADGTAADPATASAGHTPDTEVDGATAASAAADGNDVCPWEDE